MTGFGVLSDELVAHAGRVDALRDRLDVALDAASQTHLGTNAYGVICQFFVPVVQSVSGPGVQAISEAARAATSTAAGIRETAASYEGTDTANARPFRR